MTTVTINTSNKINTVSPLLYGIFFEDINYAGDGGLYAELTANRSFEYYDRDGERDLRKLCWETVGGCDFSVRSRFPVSSAHANYARLTGGTGSGLRNLGFCGEGLAVHGGGDFPSGNSFRFSCYARNAAPISLLIRLADREGRLYCEKKLMLVRAGHGWTKYTSTLTASGDCKNAYLEILLGNEGTVDLDLISLFPTQTFCGRQNGMRKDLAEKLKALSPKFMRFPGGCIVEGRSFENMYNWKETVGALTERRTNWNRWQMEEYQREGRSSEDYFQSYGLGFYEYFQLCEDLGAKPVPVLNAGMTCQWHEGLLARMDELDRWIQDALDLVEFANGSPDSEWGMLRTKMGHPEPFGLEYLAIGNEQWGEAYFERYEAFQKAFSREHPEIRLITSAGWTSDGEDFDTAYTWMRENKDKAYAVDEHFYKSPEWFLENIGRYDQYDRTLPKVFAGEYAAHTSKVIEKRENNWHAALCEAAFLTGVEKNADHVIMACYAPLFGRTGHQQWQPNLIWFDNDSVYCTPSYYVQQIFSNHTGAFLVETNITETESAGTGVRTLDTLKCGTATSTPSLAVSATLSETGGHLYVKLVNLSPHPADIDFRMDKPAKACTLHELSAPLEAVNSHSHPLRVSPVTKTLDVTPSAVPGLAPSAVSGPTPSASSGRIPPAALPLLTIPGYSATVLDISL